MLKVEGLVAYYGEAQALENVSFELPDSGVTALLGANAAGKTTTLRVVSGVLAARKGTVMFNGEDITKATPEERVRLGIVHVPEGRRLFGTLTVEENLLLGGYSRRKDGKSKDRLARIYSMLPKLSERRTQLAGTLSGGEQQMCAVGRGLMSEPTVLMIDEMSLGLAPVIVSQMFTFVKEIAAEGVSVLLVEQQVQHALQAADRATIIDKGVTTHSGTAEEIRNDPKVREAYLGV
ncbi:ABC transporter ATP-binding protein [Arthrobacter sp. TB 23]|uniref:ABC transporter ATP-binding protein n=1 Tax=Arthrobacter sp. TB 23 TaxID=494419 RepID=UPI0002E5D03D|nr:ABC transporter ATP-binding protein [Arthrobacter sp. TB 23]